MGIRPRLRTSSELGRPAAPTLSWPCHPAVGMALSPSAPSSAPRAPASVTLSQHAEPGVRTVFVAGDSVRTRSSVGILGSLAGRTAGSEPRTERGPGLPKPELGSCLAGPAPNSLPLTKLLFTLQDPVQVPPPPRGPPATAHTAPLRPPGSQERVAPFAAVFTLCSHAASSRKPPPLRGAARSGPQRALGKRDQTRHRPHARHCAPAAALA